MTFNNNKLFSKNKDLYNTMIVDYSDNLVRNVLDLISKEDLETSDLTQVFERIDTYKGLFSTQQLFNLDWSKFENHTFFDSAISKVNFVFDKLLNDFPYDQSIYEYEDFLKNLDGYTHYILKDLFPKSTNSIFLGENFVEVVDFPGKVLNEKLGTRGSFNNKIKPVNFDFWINLNNQTTNDKRIIAQKLGSHTDTNNTTYDVGFTLYISNDTEKTLNLLITNTDQEYLKASIPIDYYINNNKYLFDKESQDGYFHVSVLIENLAKRDLVFYINGKKISCKIEGSITKKIIEASGTSFNNASLLLGNGHPHRVIIDNNTNNNFSITDEKGLDGLLDEFRIFHKRRSPEDIRKEINQNIFSQDSLIAYLKFNEPSGIFTNSFLALDSSGNKLHGQIKSSTLGGSITNQSTISEIRSYLPAPILKEKDVLFPVIFPDFLETKDLHEELLLLADDYDSVNPNIIYNLFPKHYFVEGSDFEDNTNIFSNKNSFSKKKDLGIISPATQEFVNILLIWARFFDELKCYIDNLSEIINTDYDSLNNQNSFGVVIPLATKLLGFDFKNMFPSSTKQKLDGYNLNFDNIKHDLGIRKLQNEIWKRILINSQDFLRSKGTINSIKSIFNSVGIESDRFFDIKEYNGKNKLKLQATNKVFTQNIRTIDFSDNSIFLSDNTLTDEIPDHKLRLTTDNIFDHFSPNPATSGSFTYEGYYKFNEIKNNLYNLTQSLCLLNKENEALTLSEGIEVYEPIISLSFNRKNYDTTYGTLILEIQATHSTAGLNYQKIEIENINLINNEIWHIAFGRKEITNNIFENFLYVKQAGNKKYIPHVLTKKQQTISNIENINFHKDIPTFVSIGLRYFNPQIASLGSDTPSLFEGEVSNIRFYNSDLQELELLQRSYDISYLGFEDSLEKRKLVLNLDFSEQILESDIKFNNVTNSNFIYLQDKSKFNIGKQAWHQSADDVILDDSGNNIQYQRFTDNTRLPATLVTRSTPNVLLNSIKRRNILTLKNDSRIDESFNSEKIKIISFDNNDFYKLNNEQNSHDLSLGPDLVQKNEVRLSIEHSNVKYLNQDISKMIGSLKFLSNAYGLSSNIYDSNYSKISAARELYFEKLVREIDFKPMQQAFKYFDNILTDLIEDSIPSKVNFMGLNYIYESHALERHKYEYKMSECRIPIEDEGYNFSRPVINSPRTNRSIERRLYKSFTGIESSTSPIIIAGNNEDTID